MSAIDNAFIRAFKSGSAPAGGSSPKASPRASHLSSAAVLGTSNGPAANSNVANASMAANKVNRPHFKPTALRSTVEHTIVPAPHIDLSRFASTVTTLDEPKPATIPVRIDPPAVAHRKPHAAALRVRDSGTEGRGSGVITRDPEIGTQPVPRLFNPAPTATVAVGSRLNEIPNAEISPSTAHPSPLTSRPALEVDCFSWPEPNDALIERVGPQADELTQELMAEAALGRKVIAVAGDARDAGATTLTLMLARRLAKSGAKVAVVDADFAAPQLATRLGLVIGIGWETVLALPEKTSVWDTMVESIEDRLVVVPLASRSRLAMTGEIVGRLADCLNELSEAFDLVLVDVGAISAADQQSSWVTSPGNGLDAAVVACDVRSAEAERLTSIGRRLMDANIAALGVAENFCA
jgi:Mrp family chromosome partitioning ATPase